MAYTPFKPAKPDLVDDGSVIVADTRTNIQALRDMYIFSGYLPGWDVEKQNLDGSPATNPELPAQVVASRGTERLKVQLWYYGTGNVRWAKGYYSSNSGTNYDLIADTDYPLGTLEVFYNGDDILTGWAWA